jgi:hypothetical protein
MPKSAGTMSLSGNPYSKHPLKVVLLNPKSGEAIRTYVLIGTTPKAVAEAARRAGKWQAKLAPQEVDVLRGYFGAEWKELLAPGEAPGINDFAEEVESIKTGGGGFGDLDDFDRIDELPDATAAPPHEAEPVAPLHKPTTDTGPLIYSDIAVYPEDTIWDLRLKIFVAAGIPPYRQHLFYTSGDGMLRLPYRVALESGPIVSDIRALYSGAQTGQSENLVAGVPVDAKFEEQKESLTVDALDTFQKLEIGAGVYVTAVYIVDLYSVVPPTWESATQRRAELVAVLQDKYQFDLLYYGGIVRFWPQLSPDALQLVLTDVDTLSGTYPLLAPDLEVLRTRLNLERTLAERAHAYRFPRDPRTRPSIAVTSAEVQVGSEGIQGRVAVRNLFDWIPTSAAIPALVARFDVVDQESGTVASIAMSRRHATSHMPRVAPTLDRFSARAPRKPAVAFAVLRSGIAAESERGSGAPLAFMTLLEDSRYIAMSQWREDDRVPFDQAREDLSKATAPIIRQVNAMGPAALPFGGLLAEISDSRSAAFGSITVSTFWPHAVTSEGFRQIKNRWRDYEKAGIVGIKGLQQAGAYVLQFRKGIVGYDPTAIERSAIRRFAPGAPVPSGKNIEETISVANKYMYLTDVNVLARWNVLYGGRTVRIYHRATDIRIEVVGAEGMSEFDIIRQYLFAFLDGLLAGPGKLEGLRLEKQQGRREREDREEETLRGPGSRRLRRLQEKDPNLFDLKKYDENATVYSVLCQAGRQPHVYGEDEIAGLPPKKKAALVKYWNFTENRPAYYECPSSQYPYLSFRAGQHPLGYCLPCCKKTRPAEGSRAAIINEECIRARKRETAPDEEAASRHVLSYGKIVPVGRISDIASTVAGGIFHEAVPRPYSLKLVGVPQTTPSIPDAGFMFSVASAISDEDETFEDVVQNLAKISIEMDRSFSTLGSGAAAVFGSAASLADSLIKAFVEKSPELTPLSPGGEAGATWRDIVRDLVRLAYGVEIVVLADRAADGDVIIEASPETIGAFFPATEQEDVHPPELRVALVATVGGASTTGTTGTYPLFALDPKAFLRIPAQSRSKQARRTFVSSEEKHIPSHDKEQQVTPQTDHVVSMLRDVLSLAGPSPGLALDLRLLISACAGSAEYRIMMKLANLRGKCYGTVIAHVSSKQEFFFPVRESPNVADGFPMKFGTRPNASNDKDVLDKFLRFLNTYAAAVGERPASGEPFVPIATLVTTGTTNGVGFALGDPAGSFLLCYHVPREMPTAASELSIIYIPYDPLAVDEAITESRGGRLVSKPPASLKMGEGASYANRLYRLFTAEFAAAMKEERNAQVRKKLSALIRDTQFDSPSSVTKFREALNTVLKLYPEDLRAVRVIVARELSQPSRDVLSTIDRAISASIFGFDYSTLRELREKSHNDIVLALRKIMAGRIDITDSTLSSVKQENAPGNIFTACTIDSSVDRPQCYGGKLLVPSSRLDAMIDILAADIADKRRTVALTLAAGVFSERDFIERPGETLRVIESPFS